MPITPFRGVRISWLISRKNCCSGEAPSAGASDGPAPKPDMAG
ncbi:hypothetical protein V8F63_05065 [Brevundimonas sp. LF-1]